MPLGLALVSAAFPPERRGRGARASTSRVTGLAVASGPVVGGAITEGLAWEWIFWLNVPIGLVADPARAAADPREPRAGRARSTCPGSRWSPRGAFGVVWGLVRGNAAGLGQPRGASARSPAGSLLAAAFVRLGAARARADAADALLPLARVLGRQRRRCSSPSPSLFGAVFFLAQFLQTGLGYGPLGAGLRLLPWTVTLFFVAPVAGALVDRFGERPFMVAGLLLQGDRDGLDRADRRPRDVLRAS